MTFEIGDEVQFELDCVVFVGTVTSVRGAEPYRVVGVKRRGVSENYLIPERHLRHVL